MIHPVEGSSDSLLTKHPRKAQSKPMVITVGELRLPGNYSDHVQDLRSTPLGQVPGGSRGDSNVDIELDDTPLTTTRNFKRNGISMLLFCFVQCKITRISLNTINSFNVFLTDL